MSDPFEAICRARKTSTPESAVRGACLQLLREAGVLSAPVALRPLMELLSVRFEWTPRSYQERRGQATLLLERGGYRILLHDPQFKENWRRTRFTLAHELAHVVVARILGRPELIEQLDTSDARHRTLERICDAGAAEMLMPTPLFRTDMQSAGFSPEALLGLYDRYLVSRQALLWRVGEIIPRGAVIQWRTHARHEGEEIAPRVLRTYPTYSKRTERPWLPPGATTKHAPELRELLEASDTELPSHIPDLSIELRDRTWKGCGILTAFSPARPSTQPVLEGFRVPDERPSLGAPDRILIAAERGNPAIRVTIAGEGSQCVSTSQEPSPDRGT